MAASNDPFGTLVWFMGVIENTVDPLKVNRVQIRAIGYHTADRSLLPTEKLPWATFMQSPANLSAPMAVPGSWVVGMFLDGRSAQQPIVIGLLDGIPIHQDPNVGFTDPSGKYPKVYNKPSTSPLARGDLSATNPITYSKGSAASSVPTAAGGHWSEPPSPYAAQYPQNHVFHTDGDNIIELDDTAGAERIHIFHASGSLIEIHPDGSVVYRAVGSRYQVTAGSDNLAVAGDCNLTCGGNMNLLAGGTLTLGAQDVVITATDDVKIGAGGDIGMNATGDLFAQGASVFVEGDSLFAADAALIALSSGESEEAPDVDTPPSVDVAPTPKYNAGQ